MDNMTAKVSCFARAYHFENNKTHIFADSMAKLILGDDFNQIAELRRVVNVRDGAFTVPCSISRQ